MICIEHSIAVSIVLLTEPLGSSSPQLCVETLLCRSGEKVHRMCAHYVLIMIMPSAVRASAVHAAVIVLITHMMTSYEDITVFSRILVQLHV